MNRRLIQATAEPVTYREDGGRSEDLKKIALVIDLRTDMTQKLVAGRASRAMKTGTTGPAGPLLKRHLQVFEYRALSDIHGMLVTDIDAEATPGTTFRADQIRIPIRRQGQRLVRTDTHAGIAAVTAGRIDHRYGQGEFAALHRREKFSRWTPPLVAIIRLQFRSRPHHAAEKAAPAHLRFGDIPVHTAGPAGRHVR